MTLNENTVKEKWTEIKGDLKKSWGKLNDDELEKTKGDMKAIQGLLQKSYGETQESYHQKVTDVFNKYDGKKTESINAVKGRLPA